MQVLAPVFDKEFSKFAYGYRQRMGFAQPYKRAISMYSELDSTWVACADIQRFFPRSIRFA